MTTRLYDTPHGKILQFERLLVDRGDLSGEEIEAILRQPELVDKMVAALREQLAPPAPQIFRTPQEILDRFLMYPGRQEWPFDLEALSNLRKQMPTDHVSNLNKILTLDVWLGDLPTTFEALAGWIQYEQRQIGNGFWRWDALRSDAQHLRLLDPKRYGDEPSVRWVELDMLANRGSRPRDVRDPGKSAGLQVMTAAAVHPAYPPAIDYESIPGAWLPGLQATISGFQAWANVPILNWRRSDRGVDLYASWDDSRAPDYAVPEFREL